MLLLLLLLLFLAIRHRLCSSKFLQLPLQYSAGHGVPASTVTQRQHVRQQQHFASSSRSALSSVSRTHIRANRATQQRNSRFKLTLKNIFLGFLRSFSIGVILNSIAIPRPVHVSKANGQLKVCEHAS